jgi:multiple sugar transport system substrate-binding protein
VTWEGRVWATPYGLDTHFLFYRRDVFERAGMARDWEPANVAAILDAARTIKENVPGVIPYALYGGEVGGNATAVVGFVPLLFAYGGTFFDQNGKWIIDSPAIRKTFAFYARAFRDEQVVPPQILTTPNPGRLLRERLAAGELAIMFENAAAYGPWREADPGGAEENIGYLLHPTEDGGPSFTVGGTGSVWFISARSEHPDLAWELVKALNAKEAVAAIDLADPHPVARSDAAELPAYQADRYLVEATASLQQARFNPPSPHYLDLIPIIQKATGLVATGEAAPEEAAARYAEDLERVLGADNVVTQG